MATGTLLPTPEFQAVDGNGTPYAGGTLDFYASGGTTRLATYPNAALTPGTENTNPIVLNSAGRALVYLQPAAYRVVLKDSGGVLVYDVDPVTATPPFNIDVDVVALAGTAIAAGDVVYLSDGSGALNAGRWYLADADFPYASIQAVLVGMAPAAIASGATGAVRLLGRITGLAGLTAGATYYVSATAGALTATRPVNAMIMGVADFSTTALILRPRQVSDLALDRVVATVTQAAAGPTTHYTYSVLGGTLGTRGKFRLRMIGDFLNNTGVDRTVRVLATYGGLTIFDSNAQTIVTDAARRGCEIFVDLSANNSTSLQTAYSSFAYGAVSTGAGSGGTRTVIAASNAVGADSTVAQTLLVTVTLSTTDANLVYRTFTTTLELM